MLQIKPVVEKDSTATQTLWSGAKQPTPGLFSHDQPFITEQTHADEGMKLRAPDFTKDSLVRPIAALMVFATASIVAAPWARADPPSVDESQDPTSNQDSAEESNRTNNGGDIMRPQTAFEIRTSDRTSSNEASKTNDAQMLLRMSSKIPLDDGWRVGLLA